MPFEGFPAAGSPTPIPVANKVCGLLAGPSRRLPDRAVLGEASAPEHPASADTASSDVMCCCLQRSSASHRLPGSASARLRSVGPGLRVLPLTPQIVFSLQSSDSEFPIPLEAGGSRGLPTSLSPRLVQSFREPGANRNLLARSSRRPTLDVLIPSNNHGPEGH